MKTLFGFKLSKKKAMLFNELYHKELKEDYYKCLSVIRHKGCQENSKRYISNFIEKWSNKQIRLKFKIDDWTAMIDALYSYYYDIFNYIEK